MPTALQTNKFKHLNSLSTFTFIMARACKASQDSNDNMLALMVTDIGGSETSSIVTSKFFEAEQSNDSPPHQGSSDNMPDLTMKDTTGSETSSTVISNFSQAGQFNDSPPRLPTYEFRKEFYFFYGTLMDSATLAMVLRLRYLPVLVPAKISGYHCKLWGEYPALVDGVVSEVVHGMAYEVRSSEEERRLNDYETDHYFKEGCSIELDDWTRVMGNTFKWHGDNTELKEGRFDLKDWKMDRLERELVSA
jgi:hypothetical protein